jgi:Ankyrin repeats (3 copies)
LSSSIPLTQAVTSGDESAVSALLAGGANVNETTSGGQTPLILAVIFGHTNLIKLLIKAGADPHVRDNLGLDAIEWAKRRGLTEAVGILTNTSQTATAPRKIVVNIEDRKESAPKAPAETVTRETVASDEKSRRWLTGLKQRVDEIEARKLNRNESHEPLPEPRQEPRPKPRVIEEPPPLKTPVKKEATREAPVVETKPAPAPAATEPVAKPAPTGRILAPPEKSPTPSAKRKRCPKCNAIYNGELVSYCAHHIVPLVDADEPIISQPPRRNPPMFWIMVIITLSGSIVVGSLITAYMYKTNQAAARSAAGQQSNIQKGFPEVGGELTGKAVSLPEARCPLTGPQPLSGTVTVRVMVDRKGQVYWARASGGDWLMRGSATEAAMKSTFAAEKLRARETEGTITYTFKP